MPCVYNQAVGAAIRIDISVVDAEEEGVKGIVVIIGLGRGLDNNILCFNFVSKTYTN